MDFQTLKFFCTVVGEGSFSKAAKKLHYAQSNLSTKIMQLEKELDTTLFYRTKNGVTLTPKGEVFLQYANNLINLENETTLAMKDNGKAQGTIKIGSMESTIITFLSKFLCDFHKNTPLVSVNIETSTTESLIKKVLEHKLDGAFVSGPLKHPELHTKKIRNETLCIIGSKRLIKDKGFDEILQKPFLVFPKGCSYRRVLEKWITDEGYTLSMLHEFTTLNAIFASVTSGLGIALFPKKCIEQYMISDDLMILDIPEKYSKSETLYIYRKDSYLSSTLCSFINAL